MRILAVDDSEYAREVLEAALHDGGFENLTFCANAGEALSALETEQPDLILLDILMPEMDGIELCARIRTLGRYEHTPIIMITAQDEAESLSLAYMAGATDYVTKPFQNVELHARVRNGLRLKSELDRRDERERELVALREVAASRNHTEMTVAPTLPGLGILDIAVVEPLLKRIERRDATLRCAVCVRLPIDLATRLDVEQETIRDMVYTCAAALRSCHGKLGDLLFYRGDGQFLCLAERADEAECRALVETFRTAVAGIGPELISPTEASVATPGIGFSIAASPKVAPSALLADALLAAERADAAGGGLEESP